MMNMASVSFEVVHFDVHIHKTTYLNNPKSYAHVPLKTDCMTGGGFDARKIFFTYLLRWPP